MNKHERRAAAAASAAQPQTGSELAAEARAMFDHVTDADADAMLDRGRALMGGDVAAAMVLLSTMTVALHNAGERCACRAVEQLTARLASILQGLGACQPDETPQATCARLASREHFARARCPELAEAVALAHETIAAGLQADADADGKARLH